ncbi:2-amino-3-ketobutyrate coenzyme A ligase [Streptomyces glaucescens]
MDGYVAPLREICDLADRYDAMVMVDDSTLVGFVGPGGRGTPELHGVMDRVDIITGTLGKALGGASGGYVAARAEIVALLRQRSRPYLFSNTLAPVIAAASLKVLQLLESADDLRVRLAENTALFRRRMTEEGFDILPGDHAIAPVMIGDAAEAGRMAELLLERGVYVIGFSYPVVPQGQARIRVQLSAAHSTDDVNRAVDSFVAARAELAWAELRRGLLDEIEDLADLLADTVAGGAYPSASSPRSTRRGRRLVAGAGHHHHGGRATRRLGGVRGGPAGRHGQPRLPRQAQQPPPRRAGQADGAPGRPRPGRGGGCWTTAEQAAAAAGIEDHPAAPGRATTDSPAERLYGTAGWTRLGAIPGYAADPGGELARTTIYYSKQLGIPAKTAPTR